MRRALLVLVLLTAGCLRPAEDSTIAGEARLSGGFTEATSQADVAEADALVSREGGRLLVMQSFPMQFQAEGLDGEACERVRAQLQAKAYVSHVGSCQEAARGGDPEEPTSNA